MKFFLFIIISACLGNWAHAQHEPRLPETSLISARNALTNYMHAEFSSEVHLTIRFGTVSGITPLLMLIEEISTTLDNPTSMQRTQRGVLLDTLRSVAARSVLSKSNKLVLHEALTPLLAEFSAANSLSGPKLTAVYTQLQLWTVEDLWFLLIKAKQSVDVLNFYEPILSVGKQLGPDELRELNQSLNLARPYALPALLIQYQLNTLVPGQYPYLLKYLQESFVPDVVAGEDYLISAPVAKLRVRALAVLEDLQARYNQGDRTVIDAVRYREQKPGDEKMKLFYELFAKNDFRNLSTRFPSVGVMSNADPLNIEKRVSQSHEVPVGPISHVETRTGNLLKVDFTQRCMDIFVLDPAN